MSYVWKPEEITKLKQMIEDNCTKTEISEALGRTVNAIQIKVNRLGLAVYNTSDNKGNRGRDWRPSDEDELRELWKDATLSMNVICDRLHRSFFSVRKKALELELGSREYDTEFLSIPTICEEMQVSHDRVANWIKLGLPRKKNRSGKTKYLISADDLLEFLESHQDYFNASLISDHLFWEEPQWLIDKRKRDAEYYPSNLRYEYTNEEDKKIQYLFNRGKSDEEIAKEIGRTVGAVVSRRHILNLMRDGAWSDDEIAVLKKYSRYKTIEELQELIPGRRKKGIEWMCRKLKIPYHLSKSKCEKFEDS